MNVVCKFVVWWEGRMGVQAVHWARVIVWMH